MLIITSTKKWIRIVSLSLALVFLVLCEFASAKTIGGVHKITKVTDYVFVFEPHYGGGNSTVVINSDHVVVIDSQGSPAAAAALIEEIGLLTKKPIKYVINTHWHGDHHGGNSEFLKLVEGVTVIAHKNSARDMAEIANRELKSVAGFLMEFVVLAELNLNAGIGPDKTKLTPRQKAQLAKYVGAEKQFLNSVADWIYPVPDIFIDDSISLIDQNNTIRVESVGSAHTEGDLLVFLENEKIAVLGDLLTAPYVVPRSGYPRQYANVLRQIARSDAKKFILGHGGPVKNDTRLLILMADFMEAVANFAKSNQQSDALVKVAVTDPSISKFDSEIDWDEPGLRFLNFESLVGMTLNRAYVELDN